MTPRRRAPPRLAGPGPGAEVWERVPVALRERFASYLELLERWNAAIDLVAPAPAPLLVSRHLLDALELLTLVPPGPAHIVDVGSGAGLPGIPWALARPELRLILLEPRSKRAAFLRTALRELQLDAEVREERVEDLVAAGTTYDAAVARALAPYERWLALGAPLLRPGGHLHAQAGVDPPPGWADPAFCARFALLPEEERVYTLPGLEPRRALRLRRLSG